MTKKSTNLRGGARIGAGRKARIEDVRRVVAEIPVGLANKLDRLAKSRGQSRTAAVIDAIEAAVK